MYMMKYLGENILMYAVYLEMHKKNKTDGWMNDTTSRVKCSNGKIYVVGIQVFTVKFFTFESFMIKCWKK